MLQPSVRYIGIRELLHPPSRIGLWSLPPSSCGIDLLTPHQAPRSLDEAAARHGTCPAFVGLLTNSNMLLCK